MKKNYTFFLKYIASVKSSFSLKKNTHKPWRFKEIKKKEKLRKGEN
jgi:hypothetical protein